jgi:hypothetical protein
LSWTDVAWLDRGEVGQEKMAAAAKRALADPAERRDFIVQRNNLDPEKRAYLDEVLRKFHVPIPKE